MECAIYDMKDWKNDIMKKKKDIFLLLKKKLLTINKELFIISTFR